MKTSMFAAAIIAIFTALGSAAGTPIISALSKTAGSPVVKPQAPAYELAGPQRRDELEAADLTPAPIYKLAGPDGRERSFQRAEGLVLCDDGGCAKFVAARQNGSADSYTTPDGKTYNQFHANGYGPHHGRAYIGPDEVVVEGFPVILGSADEGEKVYLMSTPTGRYLDVKGGKWQLAR
ncbi:MAG: hypothetical protein PHP45_04660 [Elusimicrobiales bacterium]|nr:hypothetical protein [Elusimicrobiales bacterium]